MLALSLVIFVSGILVGAGMSTAVIWRVYTNSYQQPERITRGVKERVENFLELSPEQKTRVDAIIEKHISRILEIRNEMQPRYRDQLHIMREEIAEVLTHEQRVRWRNRFSLVERIWLPRAAEAPTEDQNLE